MKLKEIQQLSNKALGEQIADLIEYKTNNIYWVICETFASDLNSISEVETILRTRTLEEDTNLFSKYGECLFRLAISYYPFEFMNGKIKTDSPVEFAMIATATARQRAEACLFALTNYDEPVDTEESSAGNDSSN